MKRDLTPDMLEVLTAHLLGPFHLKIRGEAKERRTARRRLLSLKAIRWISSPRFVRRCNRPWPTVITDLGREIVALELAHLADELEPTGTGFPIESPSTLPATESPAPQPIRSVSAPLLTRVPRLRDEERVSGGAR